ncbi:hypothetical protein QQ045_017285 [Rhodiola kirilowii]
MPEEKLMSQCEIDTFKASGPGGQNRNKRETTVRINHRPAGIYRPGVRIELKIEEHHPKTEEHEVELKIEEHHPKKELQVELKTVLFLYTLFIYKTSCASESEVKVMDRVHLDTITKNATKKHLETMKSGDHGHLQEDAVYSI